MLKERDLFLEKMQKGGGEEGSGGGGGSGDSWMPSTMTCTTSTLHDDRQKPKLIRRTHSVFSDPGQIRADELDFMMSYALALFRIGQRKEAAEAFEEALNMAEENPAALEVGVCV